MVLAATKKYGKTCAMMASSAEEAKKWQPATSATPAVSSREPPSATITSRTIPAVAPGTSAASVGTSGRSES